jgi:hypothetical protein
MSGDGITRFLGQRFLGRREPLSYVFKMQTRASRLRSTDGTEKPGFFKKPGFWY